MLLIVLHNQLIFISKFMPSSVNVLKMKEIERFCQKLAIKGWTSVNIKQAKKWSQNYLFGVNVLLLNRIW